MILTKPALGLLSFVPLLAACEGPIVPPEPPADVLTIVVDVHGGSAPGLYFGDLEQGDWSLLAGPEGEPRQPSAANGVIVFSQQMEDVRRLRRLQLNTGALTTLDLAGPTGNLSTPAVSPDAALVAFTATAQGAASKVWTAPAAGGQATRVTTAGALPIETSPAWSHDGSRLAFVSTAGGAAQIHVRVVASGETQAITTGGPHVEPAWHPTRNLIAYAAERDDQTDVYVRDLDTGLETRVTDRAEGDFRPAWISNDVLVYVSRVGSVLTLRRVHLDAPQTSTLVELPGGNQPGHPTGVR